MSVDAGREAIAAPRDASRLRALQERRTTAGLSGESRALDRPLVAGIVAGVVASYGLFCVLIYVALARL